jgi:hypothetical protein
MLTTIEAVFWPLFQKYEKPPNAVKVTLLLLQFRLPV